MLDEKNELRNRSMHVSGAFSKIQKQDIDAQKQDIDAWKLFESKLKLAGFSQKTMNNVGKIYEKYGFEEIFGREK